MTGISVGAGLRQQVTALAEESVARHRVVEVGVDGLATALADTPVRLSTMGRGRAEDGAAFLAAAAAGRHAATQLP